MGEIKEMKRNVNAVKAEGPLPIDRIPASIKMPEQLTEDELRSENARLRNVLKQADSKIQELANGWGLKRLEFLFAILSDKGFDENVNQKVRNMICEDLGVMEENKDSE
jgi:hypothetical protein